MIKLLSQLFQNKKDKDVQELLPLVDEINAEYEKLHAISDDELRQKTFDFQAEIQDYVSEIKAEVDKVKEQAAAAGRQERFQEQESLFEQIDALKKQRNKAYEDKLQELLPQAFAVVKETCRRYAENGALEVTRIPEIDDKFAEFNKAHKRFQNVLIDGDTVKWLNRWEVSGAVTEWHMIHYDVQLIGGIVLHQGKIAEMATGEGKTLVATLPAYLNALTGEGVHIVTVNTYLAKRDREWNSAIFEFHGLKTDCVDIHQPNSDERRAAYYDGQIIYGTNNEFGFDYLRDNMVTNPDHLVQREHHYAIIDEIDSVLIDEARTPLIISGPVPEGDRHEFNELKAPIEKLIRKQRQIVQENLSKAKTLIQNGDHKEGGKHLFAAKRGLPNYKPLVKYLSEEDHKYIMQKAEGVYYADNQRLMPEIDEGLCFSIDEKNNNIELTDQGREFITPKDQPDLFVLPDRIEQIQAIEADDSMTDDEKLKAKEDLSREFAEKSERLHSIQQLLKAYTLFEEGIDYLVQDGKVVILDKNTNRAMPGRRYSDGLHQAIEAKENVKVEAATQTYATITLQNFFRMYHKLAGMTGTAETEANEFFEIYKLDVVVIPTNRPIARMDKEDLVYRTKREKFKAIVDEVIRLRESGRPILVGTDSVQTSEELSRYLRPFKVPHEVLNARNHAREADIVAQAGQAPEDPKTGKRLGNITIATNMAGRGTDIKLGEGVKEAGGLAIIGSVRHDSRRIDLQLRGRAGRQGDPGSSQFFISLEDDLMRMFGSERIAKVMKMMKVKEGEVLQHRIISKSIANAQRKVEENNFSVRKRLLEYDDIMNKQREVIYARRKNALFGERLQLDLDHMFLDTAQAIAERYAGSEEAQALQLECIRVFGTEPEVPETELTELKPDQLAERIYEKANQRYQERSSNLANFVYSEVSRIAEEERPKMGKEFEELFLEKFFPVAMSDRVKMVRFYVQIGDLLNSEGANVMREFEKTVLLGTIDDHWKDHLRQMDELKQEVQTQVYAQKDPLVIYKQEAFKFFMSVIETINRDAISILSRAELVVQQQAVDEKKTQKREDMSRLKTDHADADAARNAEGDAPTKVTMEDGRERKLSRRERREIERREKKKKKKQNA